MPDAGYEGPKAGAFHNFEASIFRKSTWTRGRTLKRTYLPAVAQASTRADERTSNQQPKHGS